MERNQRLRRAGKSANVTGRTEEREARDRGTGHMPGRQFLPDAEKRYIIREQNPQNKHKSLLVGTVAPQKGRFMALQRGGGGGGGGEQKVQRTGASLCRRGRGVTREIGTGAIMRASPWSDWPGRTERSL